MVIRRQYVPLERNSSAVNNISELSGASVTHQLRNKPEHRRFGAASVEENPVIISHLPRFKED